MWKLFPLKLKNENNGQLFNTLMSVMCHFMKKGFIYSYASYIFSITEIVCQTEGIVLQINNC